MAAFATARSAHPLLLAVLLAGLFIGGLPSLVGVTIVAFDSKPALSLESCHPLQSADPAAVPVLTTPEPLVLLRPILPDFGAVIQTETAGLKDRSDPPDSPPPK
jgi:hypothetical protein